MQAGSNPSTRPRSLSPAISCRAFAIGASGVGRERETLFSIPFEEAAMLLTIPFTPGTPNRWFRAATIVARAACGLLVHSLVHPRQAAVISRATGRVVAR